MDGHAVRLMQKRLPEAVVLEQPVLNRQVKLVAAG
jgi:hypothetical protein